jgi:pantothenate synthetase
VACPTVREAGGLAVSSRNAYLSTADRKAALSLSQALRSAAEAYRSGERDAVALRRRMVEVLEAEPAVAVEYAEVVDSGNFSSPGTLAVVAARVGQTRLIDNHDLANPYSG